MKEEFIKKQRKLKRLTRTRKKLQKQGKRLRLSVFRSNRYLYAQIIDDVKGATLLSAHESEILAGDNGDSLTKTRRAELLGEQLGKKAKQKKIAHIVFDRGSYRYHGRVKAFAEALRREGLVF